MDLLSLLSPDQYLLTLTREHHYYPVFSVFAFENTFIKLGGLLIYWLYHYQPIYNDGLLRLHSINICKLFTALSKYPPSVKGGATYYVYKNGLFIKSIIDCLKELPKKMQLQKILIVNINNFQNVDKPRGGGCQTMWISFFVCSIYALFDAFLAI